MSMKNLKRIGLLTVMGLTALQLGSCANIPVIGSVLQSLGGLLPGA